MNIRIEFNSLLIDSLMFYVIVKFNVHAYMLELHKYIVII